eukprot:1425191-Rhodomonas_salina.1
MLEYCPRQLTIHRPFELPSLRPLQTTASLSLFRVRWLSPPSSLSSFSSSSCTLLPPASACSLSRLLFSCTTGARVGRSSEDSERGGGAGQEAETKEGRGRGSSSRAKCRTLNDFIRQSEGLSALNLDPPPTVLRCEPVSARRKGTQRRVRHDWCCARTSGADLGTRCVQRLAGCVSLQAAVEAG